MAQSVGTWDGLASYIGSSREERPTQSGKNHRVIVLFAQCPACEPANLFNQIDITDTLQRPRPASMTNAPPQVWLVDTCKLKHCAQTSVPGHSSYSISENWAAAARFSHALLPDLLHHCISMRAD
jgi:hypothetical protein